MGRRAACLRDVCPPPPHDLRTIPTWGARMSQTGWASGRTVSCSSPGVGYLRGLGPACSPGRADASRWLPKGCKWSIPMPGGGVSDSNAHRGTQQKERGAASYPLADHRRSPRVARQYSDAHHRPAGHSPQHQNAPSQRQWKAGRSECGCRWAGQYATRRSYRHDCRNCNEWAGICTCPRNLTTNVKGALRGASLRVQGERE
jgi:hypothetical protein